MADVQGTVPSQIACFKGASYRDDTGSARKLSQQGEIGSKWEEDHSRERWQSWLQEQARR